MSNALNDAYLEVAHECYRRVRDLREGSEEAETAEHALTLLLSHERNTAKDPALVLHDALRNARFIVRRSRARHLTAVESVAHLADQGVATAAGGGTGGGTPDDVVTAIDLLETLAAEAQRSGPHGPYVLAGLIEGQTSVEIATRRGISLSTVNRTTKRLRVAAVRGGFRAAA